MLDSYEALIPEYISKEDFFRYGVEKSIYVPDEKVALEWKKLKEKINSNKPLFIRGQKESSANHLFFDFYAKIINNDQVSKDPSNTQSPAKTIEALTGLKKSKDLRNYQLSSIFGRGRNIYCFTAPWNLVYIPKILDPLMSDEARGDLALEFQTYFKEHAIKKFKPYIDEFNKMVTDRHFLQSIDDHCKRLYENHLHDRNAIVQFETRIHEEFAPIQ